MCTLLEEIDNKLDQIENIGQVLDEAKTVRDDLVVKTNTANTAKSSLETSTTNANNKKNEVNAAITNATNKIQEVNTSISNANTSKIALDRSKEVADTTKINLDSANELAEHNIEELNKLGDVTDLAAKVEGKFSLFIGETLPDKKDDKTLYFKVTDTINSSSNGPIKASPTMGLKEV